jgi:hypothetical protein
MKICVLSRTGRDGHSGPYVFHLGQRRHPVVAVISEWFEAPCRCFLVRVEDGRRFVLRQHSTTGEWELAAAYGGGAGLRLPATATVRL